jgi:hypothetical protein
MGLQRTAMTPPIVSCALALMLSGCVTGMTAHEQAQHIVERHGPSCDRLGLKPESQPWIDCVIAREREQRLYEARMRAASAAALPPVRPIQAQPIYTVPHRQPSYTCRALGDSTRCDTY